jgi:hypothetical protein
MANLTNEVFAASCDYDELDIKQLSDLAERDLSS